MSCQLSRPTHLGTWPKTSMGMDKESTIYHQGTQFAIGPFLGAGTLKLNLPHRWGWGWGKIFKIKAVVDTTNQPREGGVIMHKPQVLI